MNTLTRTNAQPGRLTQIHLLTFLGANQYKTCTYTAPGFKCKATFSTFAVLRLIEELGDPGEPLRLTVFATPTANRKNANAFKQLSWPPAMELDWIEIPEDAGEDNFWVIFEAINQAVKPGETIWLDITHSFRYLPMLAFSVLDYLQTVRKIPVGGIYYGAAEVLGPVNSWPENIEDRRVPLHDLSSFLQFSQWTVALRDFNETGSADAVKRLITSKASPMLRQSRGNDHQARALRDLSRVLEDWCHQAATCRGSAIQNSELGVSVARCVEEIDTGLLPPLTHEFRHLVRTFSPLRKGAVQNLLFAAQWCADRGLVQQAWTLLQEGIVSFFTVKWSASLDLAYPLPAGLGKQAHNRKNNLPVKRRSFVSQLLNVTAQKQPPDSWKQELAARPDLALTLQADIAAGLARLYGRITERRNDINHAGLSEKAARTEAFSEVKDCLNQARKILPEAFPPDPAPLH